jgi:putative peptidoglycan lipid II flippase
MSLRSTGIRKAGSDQDKPAFNINLATLIMMLGLLLSKLSGHFREILIVPVLGYGVVSDAFIIGFQIPDLFYQLLIGGSIAAAVTPSLSHALQRGEEEKGWKSLSILINAASIVMLAAVLAGVFLSPQLIRLYNSSKAPEIEVLAARVSQALFPQVFFMMLAALGIGILNAYRQFGRTSFGPTIYNVCVVLAMILFGQASPDGAVRVAIGVTLAAAIYFAFQLLMARPLLCHYQPSLDLKDDGFRQMVRLAVPTLFSGSIVQLNTIILTGFADQFPGAATSLRNAATTWQLPYGIFVVAIGNVMLPSLARLQAERDMTGSRLLLTQSLRRALFITVPSAALFLVLKEEVIQGIFQWGSSYTSEQVVTAASILRWYALALVAQTFVFLLNQAFYSRKMTRMALYNGVLTLILNPMLCWLLLRVFGLDISGLSLAYALTSTASAIFLWILYHRHQPSAAPRKLGRYAVRLMAAACGLMMMVLFLDRLDIMPGSKILQLVWLGVESGLGLLVYLGITALLGLPEAVSILKRLRALLRRLPGLSRLV